jgi:hypothetical protein
VTLALLWEEYRGHHPDGYGYSRSCDLYVEWRHGITATMRQTHAAGEKLFVDFAGETGSTGSPVRCPPPKSFSPNFELRAMSFNIGHVISVKLSRS